MPAHRPPLAFQLALVTLPITQAAAIPEPMPPNQYMPTRIAGVLGAALSPAL